MGKDYYKILGVPKNVNQEDLKKAYKKLALKWHPDRCPPDKKEEAQTKFQEIGEAYDCLSDPEKKRIYDQVGEEGLRGGMPEGGFPEGANPFAGMGGNGGGGARTFHFSRGNADDIFKAFFGTSDPFAAGGDEGGGFGGFPGGFVNMGGMGGMPGGMGGMGGMPMGGMPGGMRGGPMMAQRKAEPVNYPLNVSLEDLYTGCTKKVRITAKRIVDQRGTTQSVSTDKEIQVKAGWKTGTKITFEREGDEAPGTEPADIIFTIQGKPHDRFERDGDDLVYECSVTLYEALTGVRTSVTTLDNRVIPLEAKSVTPQTVKIIPGEGMPNNKLKRKGDMRVKFKIVFPDLSSSEREQIGTILRNNLQGMSSSSGGSANKMPRK